MTNPYLHEFVRNHDGVVEHAQFTSQFDGTVVVSLEVITEMLRALGFRPVDIVAPSGVPSTDEQTVSSAEDSAG